MNVLSDKIRHTSISLILMVIGVIIFIAGVDKSFGVFGFILTLLSLIYFIVTLPISIFRLIKKSKIIDAKIETRHDKYFEYNEDIITTIRPKQYKFANRVEAGLYYISDEFFYKSESAVERFLPLLNKKAEIESNDETVYQYGRLFAKPDFVARTENYVYLVEFKSKNLAKVARNDLDRYLLQVLICSYAFSKNNRFNKLVCVIRLTDAVILLKQPEDYFEYIEYILGIYPGDGGVPSAKLAAAICLVTRELDGEPRNNEEKIIKGNLLHAMAASDFKIPEFGKVTA